MEKWQVVREEGSLFNTVLRSASSKCAHCHGVCTHDCTSGLGHYDQDVNKSNGYG